MWQKCKLFIFRWATICNCSLFDAVCKLLPAYVDVHTRYWILFLQLFAMNFKYGRMTAPRMLKMYYLFLFLICSESGNFCSFSRLLLNAGWKLLQKLRQTKRESKKWASSWNFISTTEFVIRAIWFEYFPLGKIKSDIELFELLASSVLELEKILINRKLQTSGIFFVADQFRQFEIWI